MLAKLTSLVRDRFGRSASDREVLESVARAPRDEATVASLAEALNRHMRDDCAFAEQLQSLWTEITEVDRQGEVTNLVAGDVHGTVVQARDVQGGITFHAPPG